MNPSPGLVREVEALAHAVCRGELEPEQSERLSSLLDGNLALCHSYLNILSLHARLIELGDSPGPEEVYDRLFPPRTGIGRLGRRVVAVAATVAAACLTVAVWTFGPQAETPVVGRVVAVAEGTEWAGDTKRNGQAIRKRDSVAVESGFVTIELPGDVVVDLVGPGHVRFDATDRVWLKRGRLAASVGLAGVGFTVGTEDADIVDLGTAFQVHKDFSLGTQLRVTEGSVQTRLKDDAGNVVQFLDLVAGESARLDRVAVVAEQTGDLFDFDAAFDPVGQAKGGVRRFTGAAQPLSSSLVGLDTRSGVTNTLGRVFVLPERSGLVLDREYPVETTSGRVTIPAGTPVDSYLFHFDMGEVDVITALGRGSTTFGGRVLAVVGSSDGLATTDATFANPGATFDPAAARGLEPDEDDVSVSADGRTVTFDFDVSPPGSLDQFRVLVRGTKP
ncbi:MAG: hypothetical protein AAF532_00620 [Planctomycetota bacterium]